MDYPQNIGARNSVPSRNERSGAPDKSCPAVSLELVGPFAVFRHFFAPKKQNGIRFVPGFDGRKRWYPRTELNRDPSFRKRLLYPFELRGHVPPAFEHSGSATNDKNRKK